MALSLRGIAEISAIDGADVTLTHPVGIAENDVVYIGHGVGDALDITITIVTTGYTQLTEVYSADSASAGNLAIWRKRMGATPDSTAVCDGSGSALSGTVAVEHVWIGVDTTTSEDATTTTAIGEADVSAPNSPEIVTVTANAIVLSIAEIAQTDTTVTAPSGYSNQVDINASESHDQTVGISSILVVSPGAENPAAWTNFATTAGRGWCAATVAIRPAAAGAAVEGILYGPRNYTDGLTSFWSR